MNRRDYIKLKDQLKSIECKTNKIDFLEKQWENLNKKIEPHSLPSQDKLNLNNEIFMNTSNTRTPIKGEVYRVVVFINGISTGKYYDAVVISSDSFICRIVYQSQQGDHMVGELLNLTSIGGYMKIADTFEEYEQSKEYKVKTIEKIVEKEIIKEVIEKVEVEKIVEKEVPVFTLDFEIGAVYRVNARTEVTRTGHTTYENLGDSFDILCTGENGAGKVLTINNKIKNANYDFNIGDYYLPKDMKSRSYKIADSIHEYNSNYELRCKPKSLLSFIFGAR